jgi:hypothetical protein
MLSRLLHIDRRWIFLTIFCVVAAPFVFNWVLPLGSVSPRTQAVYDFIDKLPAGASVVIAFDYGPASMPELQPMALALSRHVLTRKLRLVGMSLDVQGATLGQDAMAAVAKDLGAVEGRDWVNLGYKPGGYSVILDIGNDLVRVFKTDFHGTPLSKLPIMAGIKTYSDIGLLIDLASSSTPTDWITFANGRYKANIAAGVTAVMAVDYYPYLQSHQLVGLINGLKGAAEYEGLVHQPGNASLGMTSQSMAHIAIILFVALANAGYFATRRRRR